MRASVCVLVLLLAGEGPDCLHTCCLCSLVVESRLARPSLDPHLGCKMHFARLHGLAALMLAAEGSPICLHSRSNQP